MSKIFRSLSIVNLLLISAALTISTLAAVNMGHDANWDLRNYHLYNGFALLNWRYGYDIMPVGIQSMLNPLMDVPYYAIARKWGLQPATIIQSAIYALLIFAALKLNLAVFRDLPHEHSHHPLSLIFPVAATLLGVTGVAAFSQIGTTFNETLLGVLVVTGLTFVLSALDREDEKPRHFLVGGALIGAAAGLKLTSALYAPACALALVIAIGPRRGLWPALLVGVGAAVGLAATFGWWAAIVYRTYQSPIFPLYNKIFRSPWYPAINEVDTRFFPKSPAEWIAYPFNWAWRMSGEISEIHLRDPRLAALLACVALFGLFVRPFGTSSERFRCVLAFALISYVLWLGMFSISRYAVSIEIVAATVVIGLTTRLRGGAMIAVLLIALIQWATVYPAWERMPFSVRAYDMRLPPIPDGSIVLSGNPPVGFLLPFIKGKNIRFLSANHTARVSQGFGVFERTRTSISAHGGAIFLLARGGGDDDLLRSLGVTREGGACQVVTTNVEPAARDILLCELRKL